LNVSFVSSIIECMTILLLIIYVKARLNNGTISHGQTTD